MRIKLFQGALFIVVLASMVPPVLLAAGGQGSDSADQKYVGQWAGTFTTGGGDTNKLSYTLKKDGKGQWGGTVKWVNPDGDQSADFKSLEIAGDKMKGKIESPDGQVEVTIEGEFQGDKLEGTYAISPKGSTEVTERGTWKVTKSVGEKTGQ